MKNSLLNLVVTVVVAVVSTNGVANPVVNGEQAAKESKKVFDKAEKEKEENRKAFAAAWGRLEQRSYGEEFNNIYKYQMERARATR